MHKFLHGGEGWKPIEQTIWRLSIAGSVVWFLYVVVFQIMLFTPKPFVEYEGVGTVRVFNDFGDLMSAGDLRSSDITEMNGQRTRNLERQRMNQEAAEYNDDFVWRGLQKAVGYPLAWLGAVLTFITVFERLEQKGRGGS